MRIGVDLGGTKIELGALDDSDCELGRERVSTPVGDYARTIGAIVGLVERVEARLGRRGTVGIGIPGTVSPETGLVKNSNSVWLIGQPFDRDLSEALGRPVRVQNDANCFALSEAMDGAAARADVVFGAIIGTGVGGGLVVRGQLVTGRNAIAGEWGHNPLPWPRDDERPGPPCYCGKSGCVETYLSGGGLARDYHTRTGRTLAPPEIAALASKNDAAAVEVVDRYCDRMARALAAVVNIVDPDVIVLGGGMSNVTHLYDRVPTFWRDYVFSDIVATRLSPPLHGDSSGVRGAARLWPHG